MNNCFSLRFNLQKCGCAVPETADTFSHMFAQSTDFIEETLAQYDEINASSAKEISKYFNADKLKEKFRGKTIMLVGDSNTSDRLSYGKIAEKVLPCKVIDCAVSGSKSFNLAADITMYLRIHNPDIVVVQIGTNDSFFTDKQKKYNYVSLSEYEKNLEIIIERIAYSGAQIVFNDIPPNSYKWVDRHQLFWCSDEENNQKYADTNRAVAKRHGIILNKTRDIFDVSQKEVLFEPDGTHLTPTAHKALAKRFIETIYNNF